MTKGLFFEIYYSLTESSINVQIEDEVWTTSRKHVEGVWMTLMSRDEMGELKVFDAGEWCGFARSDICWNKFVIVKEL